MTDYKPTLSSAILHLQDEGYTEEAELVIALRKAAQDAVDTIHPSPEGDYYHNPADSEALDNLKALLEVK